MKKYVLGVDGGGTKSHLAIFDADAERVDFREYGTLNHECMPESFAQLERELETFVNGAMRENGIAHGQISHAVFGLAGVDTKKQHAIISGILSRLGFMDFTLCNDAYLGIPAGSDGNAGICAINGTGCTVVGMDCRGGVMQIGGVGKFSEDLGGAGKMGADVIGRVYRELFRSGEPTAMTGMIFKSLGISSKYDFTETLIGKIEDGSIRVPSYNRILFEAAAIGDVAALEILRDIAGNYAGAIGCLLGELDFPEHEAVNIVLAGSVFVKGEHPALIDALIQRVEARNPARSFRFVKLEKPPVSGAVLLALCKSGCGTELMARVCEQL